MAIGKATSELVHQHADAAHETVGSLAEGDHVELLRSMLGSDDADRLVQQLVAVAQGGAAAVKELVSVVDYEGIDSKVAAARDSGQAASSVSDADVSGLADIGRLEAATGRVQATTAAFSDVVSTLEGVLARDEVLGRLQDEMSQRSEGEADVAGLREIITGSVDPAHIGAVLHIKGVAAHLEASGRGASDDVRAHLEHIESTLDALVPTIQDDVRRLVQAVDGALARLG